MGTHFGKCGTECLANFEHNSLIPGYNILQKPLQMVLQQVFRLVEGMM